MKGTPIMSLFQECDKIVTGGRDTLSDLIPHKLKRSYYYEITYIGQI
jgi:hypothetical protein